MIVKRDPKDSALSWATRFDRINGKAPGYQDVVQSGFAFWVSNVNDRNGPTYEEWCIANIPEEDYVMDWIKVSGNKTHGRNFDYGSHQNHVIVFFTRCDDAMMFRLANG